MIGNDNGLVQILKEVVITFQVLSSYLPRKAWENHSKDSRYPG